MVIFQCTSFELCLLQLSGQLYSYLYVICCHFTDRLLLRGFSSFANVNTEITIFGVTRRESTRKHQFCEQTKKMHFCRYLFYNLFSNSTCFERLIRSSSGFHKFTVSAVLYKDISLSCIRCTQQGPKFSGLTYKSRAKWKLL